MVVLEEMRFINRSLALIVFIAVIYDKDCMSLEWKCIHDTLYKHPIHINICFASFPISHDYLQRSYER